MASKSKKQLYLIEYRKANKEKIAAQKNAYMREYMKDPENIKKNRLSVWKKRGVISEDFDALYDLYLNTTHCMGCSIALTKTGKKTRKCLDHCHETGKFRHILCHSCNISRG